MRKPSRRTKVIASIVGVVVLISLIASAFSDTPSNSDAFSLNYDVTFEGKVIVVGAGAAGLTAAYILERQGVEVQVIEAQDVYGGRMREASDFTEFPWI